MEKLFDYTNDLKIITTDNGDMKVRHIRKGPRGIIALVRSVGNIKIWGKDDTEAHKDDSETVLLSKLTEIINS